MNTEQVHPLTSRKVQPVHLVLVGSIIALCAGILVLFGLATLIRSLRFGLYISLVLTGLYLIWLARVAYRDGVVRSLYGTIERAKQPALFWTLLSISTILYPAIVAFIVVLTRDW
jgi:hypothetical protein